LSEHGAIGILSLLVLILHIDLSIVKQTQYVLLRFFDFFGFATIVQCVSRPLLLLCLALLILPEKKRVRVQSTLNQWDRKRLKFASIARKSIPVADS
jgi:hypothetical protein